MKRPRIGITTSYNQGQQTLDQAYVLAIEAAGGLPLPVPMLQSEDSAQEFASLLDGLIITGGPAIVQGLVGALPDDLPPNSEQRDHSDRLIYDAMPHQPVLGICYGMQFINAQAGGTIYGDVHLAKPECFPHSPKRGGEQHPVRLASASRLYQVFQQDALEVNTSHLQALVTLGEGLKVSAQAPDGVIEAFESEDGRLLGVQWHPEKLPHHLPLFADFVERCRQN